MPLPTTQRFLNASQADSNLPRAKVQLLLGNYLSAAAYGTTAAAQGGEESTSYPASGAIDGDRTEINVGPASGADNDLGKSSWRSLNAPDTFGGINLVMTMTQSRIINRIKVYHLSGHALKSYRLSWWDGANWQPLAATTDEGPGQGQLFDSTHQLDTIDFDDVTTTKLRLTVDHTLVANDLANVVEVEAYRKLDITDRVRDVRVSRTRDYKLANPMAAQLTLTCVNDDRYFSISHVPTATEVAAGFVNSELAPGVTLLVSQGFDYYGDEAELVSNFVGDIDRIQIRPKSRDAVIEARDGMKRLINKIDSSKLKTTQSIDTNVRYVLNRANISNYEMSLDSVSINIDYFFTDAQAQLDTIRDLVQAAGDALFYFDETGMAILKNYSAVITNQKIWTSEIDWESGALVNIDTTTTPGDLLVDYTSSAAEQSVDWANGTSGWTLFTNGTGSWGSSGGLSHVDSGAGSKGWAFRLRSGVGGRWDVSYNFPAATVSIRNLWFYFGMQTHGDATILNNYYGGYAVKIASAIGGATTVSLVRTDTSLDTITDPAETILGSASITYPSGTHAIRVVRYPSGRTLVYHDAVLLIDATDASYLTFDRIGFEVRSGLNDTTIVAVSSPGLYIPAAALVGTWTSQAVDTGTSTAAFGSLSSTQFLNVGAIAYYTRSSPDLITWSAYEVVPGSGVIQSPVNRYIEVQVTLDTNGLVGYPDILDITITWVLSGGASNKYPAPPSSFTFSFDSMLLDVQQEIADNLGGDTSILNDITVQASPLVLTGANADTVWQGSIGTPPTNISGSTPLTVVAGQTVTIPIVVSGGMDTSRMSGANPAAAVVTAGTATVSWAFSSIHPTLPVLVLTVTGSGTITDLRVIGKKFSSAAYIQAQRATDATSIAKYGGRQLSIGNPWIVSATVAASIASTLITNFKDPTAYIPTASVRPSFSAQIGDRATVVDVNADLSADYIIVGLEHELAVNGMGGAAETGATLLRVPTGL